MLVNPKIGILGLVLLTFAAVNNAFRLSPEGGYDLVLGIQNPESGVPSDDEQLRYVQNIKNSMQIFSSNLWRATKMHFHVNSLELIVPENWNSIHTVDTTYAELGGIQTADFRISPSVTYPNAKNAFLCGLPGDYVELPFDFFKNANSNDYGAIWKTLMVLFARYRYGVWEEHGFIGDEVFPYFYQNGASASWETTGCNNEALLGKFVNVTDPDRKDCEMSWSTPSTELSSCRFIPDRVGNTVTTSLMHFHWLDSVVDFCDEHNHNSFADNKQNAFCDQKSIMQVIRESPDYATVTNPVPQVPPIDFKIVMQSAKPLLYILLDRGQIQGSYGLANIIPPALAGFLGRASIQNVIAGVGSFPNPDNAAIQLKQEVGWSQIGQNIGQFLQAVGELKINGPVQRDFAQAILEVAALIKTRDHAAGAVILLVKLGADTENFDKTVPEKDVLIALNEQKIILHSIELPITGTPPVSQLSQLASETTGGYTALTNSFEAPGALNNVLNFVERTVNSDIYFTDVPTYRTVVKQAISDTLNGTHVTLTASATLVEVFYTSVLQLTRANFTTLIDEVEVPPSSFRRSVDWLAINATAGYSYRIRFNEAAIAGKGGVGVQLNCAGLEGCEGEMVGRVQLNEMITEVIKIEVTVSSDIIDLSKNIPLAIYAKATINGVTIRSYNETVIYAEAILTNGVTSYRIVLHDDGAIPDILETDGIFSAYFVPPTTGDGDYKITVRFMKQTREGLRRLFHESEEIVVRESSSGRLLPIDQSPEGSCEVSNTCPETPIEDGFIQIEEVPGLVSISNASLFSARPAKAILFYNSQSRTLSWRSPRVPGFSTSTAVQSYELRQSPNRNELLTNFDNCQIVREVEVTAPGSMQTANHDISLYSMYFGIKSVFQGVKSELSNIRSFPGTMQPEPTTTPDPTAPTTTPDPTAPTTTPDPTAPTTTPDPTAPTTTPDPIASTGPTTPDSGLTTPTVPTITGSPVTPPTTPTSGTAPPPPASNEKRWVESAAGIGTICGIIAAIILVAVIYLIIRRRRTGSRRISG